jgi:hypothetical protein
VPVAFKLVKLPVPELSVAILPTVAVNVLTTAVTAFRMLVPKFPVTVRLLAVVLPIVEDPDTVRLVPNIVCIAPVCATKLVKVVDAKVELPDTARFVVLKVFTFKTLAPRFPVTVRLLAVVEARVDEPETVRLLPRIV